jgi:hypothetical protein
MGTENIDSKIGSTALHCLVCLVKLSQSESRVTLELTVSQYVLVSSPIWDF